MSKQCPKCKTEHPGELEFCPLDGTALVAGPPPPPPPPPRDRATHRRFAGTLMGTPAPTTEPSAPAAVPAPRGPARPTVPPIDTANLPGAGGCSLRELLDRGPLPTDLAVARVANLAEVLAESPPNEPGTVTPGAVRYASAQGTGRPSLDPRAVPTPEERAAYRAPEVAQGGAAATADVYSLGCILFEALTGKQPFRGRTAEDTAKRHATAAVPAVRQVRRDCELPPALELEIQRALKKRPGDRQPSLAAFAQGIRSAIRDDDRATMALGAGEAAFLQQLLAGQNAAQGQGTQPPAPEPAPPPPAVAPKSRVGLFVALGIVALLAVAALAVVFLRSPPPPPPPPRPQPARVLAQPAPVPVAAAIVAPDVQEPEDTADAGADADAEEDADAADGAEPDAGSATEPRRKIKPKPGRPNDPPGQAEPAPRRDGPITF